MSNSNSMTFAYKVWRLSTGKAYIEKVAVAKRTKTYTWACAPNFLGTKYALSNSNKFDANGRRGNYSQEPCCERLFFTEQGAFNYAIKLNENRKPYYHGDRY